jgi:hypothetical protein
VVPHRIHPGLGLRPRLFISLWSLPLRAGLGMVSP